MPAHDVLTGTSARGNSSPGPARRLVVAWQHPDSRSIDPVGFLSYDGRSYRLAYIRHALQVRDFRPLFGFEDLHRSYASERLFPLFAQRVMDPRRPDYHRYVERLGLPDDASPWEQIARSQGRRQGDSIQLLPEPTVSDGMLSCLFLVNGVRHVPDRDISLEGRSLHVTAEQVEDALMRMKKGDALHLMPEPQNPVNPLAILVAAISLTPVGWVPDLLVEDLHRLLSHTAAVKVSVEHVNGPDAPWHMRLLARLTAPVASGFRFFSGDRWQSLARQPQ